VLGARDADDSDAKADCEAVLGARDADDSDAENAEAVRVACVAKSAHRHATNRARGEVELKNSNIIK
jgi:hypothetical protein